MNLISFLQRTLLSSAAAPKEAEPLLGLKSNVFGTSIFPEIFKLEIAKFYVKNLSDYSLYNNSSTGEISYRYKKYRFISAFNSHLIERYDDLILSFEGGLVFKYLLKEVGHHKTYIAFVIILNRIMDDLWNLQYRCRFDTESIKESLNKVFVLLTNEDKLEEIFTLSTYSNLINSVEKDIGEFNERFSELMENISKKLETAFGVHMEKKQVFKLQNINNIYLWEESVGFNMRKGQFLKLQVLNNIYLLDNLLEISKQLITIEKHSSEVSNDDVWNLFLDKLGKALSEASERLLYHLTGYTEPFYSHFSHYFGKPQEYIQNGMDKQAITNLDSYFNCFDDFTGGNFKNLEFSLASIANNRKGRQETKHCKTYEKYLEDINSLLSKEPGKKQNLIIYLTDLNKIKSSTNELNKVRFAKESIKNPLKDHSSSKSVSCKNNDFRYSKNKINSTSQALAYLNPEDLSSKQEAQSNYMNNGIERNSISAMRINEDVGSMNPGPNYSNSQLLRLNNNNINYGQFQYNILPGDINQRPPLYFPTHKNDTINTNMRSNNDMPHLSFRNSGQSYPGKHNMKERGFVPYSDSLANKKLPQPENLFNSSFQINLINKTVETEDSNDFDPFKFRSPTKKSISDLKNQVVHDNQEDSFQVNSFMNLPQFASYTDQNNSNGNPVSSNPQFNESFSSSSDERNNFEPDNRKRRKIE